MTSGLRTLIRMICCSVFLAACSRSGVENDENAARNRVRRVISSHQFPQEQYCRFVSASRMEAGSRLCLRREDMSIWTWLIPVDGYAVEFVRVPDRHDPDRLTRRSESNVIFVEFRKRDVHMVSTNGSSVIGLVSGVPGQTTDIHWAEF